MKQQQPEAQSPRAQYFRTKALTLAECVHPMNSSEIKRAGVSGELCSCSPVLVLFGIELIFLSVGPMWLCFWTCAGNCVANAGMFSGY